MDQPHPPLNKKRKSATTSKAKKKRRQEESGKRYKQSYLIVANLSRTVPDFISLIMSLADFSISKVGNYDSSYK